MEIKFEKSWLKIKDEFINSGKRLMVIGGSDTGKSTFILFLSNEIIKFKKKVGILDLDIGQSNIGPPGTIGYSIVEKEFNDFSELKSKKLYFIGSVSPKGNLLQIVVGGYKLITEMEKENFDYILIDTTGLVDGVIAEVLKQSKIEILNPDFIVLFEFNNERRNLVKPFLFENKRIFSIKPSENVVLRSRMERIEYRNCKFKEYFKNAKEIEIYFQEYNIIGFGLDKFTPMNNSIIGLLDKDRFLVCLGILKQINKDRNSIVAIVPEIEEKRVKFIKFSNLVLNSFFYKNN